MILLLFIPPRALAFRFLLFFLRLLSFLLFVSFLVVASSAQNGLMEQQRALLVSSLRSKLGKPRRRRPRSKPKMLY